MWDRPRQAHSGAMSETTINMTAPPVAPRLLRRSSTDRIFGGVCGGLGRYWNVDPVILRVAFGVSLLLGGLGVFAYLAMWMLMPDETAPADARISESWGLRVFGSIAAAVAALIGLSLLVSDVFGTGGVVFGALVAGIVVWIVLSQRSPERPADAPPTGYAYGGTTDYTATTVMEQPPMPPAPPREHSYLGLIGLCAAVAAMGIALLVTNNPTAVLAAALLALGVTLLVGAVLGRARWLLLFAVPLLMVVATVSQVQRADITAGELNWSPTSEQRTYSMTAGTLTVDFADWQGQPGPGDLVSVDMGVGEVRIEAPRNWDLVLVTDFGAGGVQVDGKDINSQPVNGLGRLTVPASSGKAEGTLRMEVSIKAGAVTVDTGAPAAGTTPPPGDNNQPADKPANQKEKAA